MPDGAQSRAKKMTSELPPVKEETPEQEKKRQEEFNAEFMALLKKYDRVPATQALLTPDGRITSQLTFMDGAKLRAAQAKQAEAAKGQPMPVSAPPECEEVVS